MFFDFIAMRLYILVKIIDNIIFKTCLNKIYGVTMAKDAVCGMEVDEKKGMFVSFNGKKYFFCSKACKEKFEADPKKYSGD